MTDMKRITVSLPDDLVAALDHLKQAPRYAGKPYSVIIRDLVRAGLLHIAKGGKT